MQPQNSPSPTPQYDFILNEQKQPGKSRFGFIKKMPKPALVLLGLGAILILILVIASISGGGSSGAQPLASATGRAQEISRISSLVQTQTKDPDTQSLAATAKVVLASEQSQFTSYLKDTGTELSPSDLSIYQDKDTDTQLTQAIQENKLEETYRKYLKSSLGAYQADLENAGKTAGKNGQALIDAALKSTKIILSAPQLTNLSGS